jgi:hypothetical protein
MEDAFTLRSAASSLHRIKPGRIDRSETERDPGYRCQNLTVIVLRLDSIDPFRDSQLAGRSNARIICLYSSSLTTSKLERIKET